MKLVRTFHPVGHGAFYTEQFYELDKCVFTAVYDCGSKLPADDLNAIIDGCIKTNTIDALFVSHMHSDHISGIKHLLDNYDCKKIFLPQLTKGQRLALLVQNIVAATERLEVGPVQALDQDGALEFIKQCYSDSRLRSRIVKIPFLEGPVELMDDVPTKNIEECRGTMNAREGIQIALVNNFEWIYFPINLKDDVEINFEGLLEGISEDDKTDDIDFEKLAEVCSKPGNWEKIVKRHTRFITNSVANEYSMTVYSGFLNPIDKRNHLIDVDCCCDCERNCGHPYCDRYRYPCCHRIDNAGCLYMGDFVPTNKNVNDLINCYNPFFPKAEVIQVPHHGSERLHNEREHYGFQLFDYAKVGVFSVKFGQYNGIPSPYVIQALKTNRVCPKIVTQKPYTALKMSYRIM